MPRPDPARALLPPGRAASAATRAAWDFSRVEEFWELYRPLTPYGREAKEERRVFADRELIEELYDRSEAWLAFEKRAAETAGPATLDRISYHLGRLPRLPDAALAPAGPALELVDIFLVKKFLANYRAVLRLLDATARAAFGLSCESEELAARLDLGGSDAETFYVADAYEPRLAETRAAIASLDGKAAELKAAARDAAARAGYDFRGRDFLVVPHEATRALIEDRRAGGAALFSVEPYDGAAYLVRLEPGAEELALDDERDALLDRERALEAEVLAALSVLIRAESGRLAAYAEGISAFDQARARAILARELGLSRPALLADPDSPLSLSGGRLLPLELLCRAEGLRYTPLDLELPERAAVIFGSNMGGKTVALETVVFLQILAQAGFHVPAARFSTPAYSLIHYVGELRVAADSAASRIGVHAGAGLSGFGFEIRSFVEAWEASRAGALLTFDEFARTTGSREAEAILSAVLEALAARSGTRSLFSTHFHGVSRPVDVRYLRMKGLDRRAAGEAFCADESISALIRRINGMMEYVLVDEDGGRGGSDAIAIAGLLGIDCTIAQRAEEIFAMNAAADGAPDDAPCGDDRPEDARPHQ